MRSPVDVGIVLLKPVNSEYDRKWGLDDAKGDSFIVRQYRQFSKDIMSNSPRYKRTIVDRIDGDGYRLSG